MGRPLSDEADAYIGSLHAADRGLAGTYARMPGDEFQARLGPVIDRLETNIARLDASLTRPPWWRSALADVGKVVGGAIMAVLTFWKVGSQ